MEDIHSSEGETLAQLGRSRSKGGTRTREAAFGKGENLSDDDTDEPDVAEEYDEGDSDDGESSNGGPRKAEPPAARSRGTSP
jgi:hypothetical protein